MRNLSIEERVIISKIVAIKNKFRKIDHFTNKWVEGELSEERWAEIKAQRKAWRAEINALEAQFQELRAKKE